MPMKHIQTLRDLISREKGLLLPGAPNALAARDGDSRRARPAPDRRRRYRLAIAKGANACTRRRRSTKPLRIHFQRPIRCQSNSRNHLFGDPDSGIQCPEET